MLLVGSGDVKRSGVGQGEAGAASNCIVALGLLLDSSDVVVTLFYTP